MKTALVTGVSGAIGESISRALRARGYLVLGVDIKAPGSGICDRFLEIDLGKLIDHPQELKRLTSWAQGEVPALDLLVNNAAFQVVENNPSADFSKWRKP